MQCLQMRSAALLSAQFQQKYRMAIPDVDAHAPNSSGTSDLRWALTIQVYQRIGKSLQGEILMFHPEAS